MNNPLSVAIKCPSELIRYYISNPKVVSSYHEAYINAYGKFKLLYWDIAGLNTISDKSKLNNFINSTIERIDILITHFRYKEATDYIQNAIKIMDTLINSRDIDLAVDNIDLIISNPYIYKSLDRAFN